MTLRGLEPADLDRVFPFHLGLDRELRVTQIGRSLHKVLPELAIGARLADHCTLVRPRDPLTYDALRNRGQDLCVLSAMRTELVLKGQILVHEGSEALLFLGSPRLTSAEELSRLGITIDDFAIHDAIVDFLFLSHGQQSALAELRTMADRLAVQRREVREAHHRLTTLYMASRVLEDSPTVEEALQVLVPSLAKTLGCEAVSSWRRDGDQLVCDWSFPAREGVAPLRLGATRGMVAGIFATGEPMWLPTGHGLADGILDRPPVGRGAPAAPGGASLGDAIDPPTIRYSGVVPSPNVPVCGLPVVDDGRVIGVIALVAPTTTQRSDDLLYLLGEIATKLAKFITHSRTTAELAAARDAAVASVRAKTEFLANVSHELRTPLSAVMGMASVLHGMQLRAPADSLVDDIQAAGQTLLRLVDDLLDESRIEAGKLSIELAPFDVASLVRATAAPFQAAAKARNIPVIVEMAEPLGPPLIGDRVRIGQVLANLIGNAVKFTESGQIRVHVGCVEIDSAHALLTMSVSDTGIGIAADQQQRVFEPFTQADGSTTRKYGGAGLGLSICRRLVELMGGTIGVSSSLGKGSTFTVELGLARAQDEIAVGRARTRPTRPAGAAGRRVLVVEDNPLGQRTSRLMLEQLGHQVDVVGDGAAALEAVAGGRYDLVLMDFHLPVLDGFEATRRIRALPAPACEVPIVACTASVMTEERRRCFEVGMDDIIVKPISPAELRRVLDLSPPVPLAPPPTAHELLDRPRIELLRGLSDRSGRRALDQMVALYREHAAVHLASLETATASRELGAARSAAHALHGMSLNIGAAAVARACASVERAAAAGTLAPLDELRVAYQDTLAALAELAR